MDTASRACTLPNSSCRMTYTAKYDRGIARESGSDYHYTNRWSVVEQYTITASVLELVVSYIQ